MEEKIEVPLHVIEDLEVIRKESKCNMMDSTCVISRMWDKKMFKSFFWLAKFRENSDGETINVCTDSKKYVEALTELGTYLGLAERLTRDD